MTAVLVLFANAPKPVEGFEVPKYEIAPPAVQQEEAGACICVLAARSENMQPAARRRCGT